MIRRTIEASAGFIVLASIGYDGVRV